MSRAAPRPFSTALRDLTATLAPTTPLARVQGTWEQAVGPAVAAAARPASVREGTLTVICESSVWAQELDLMAGDLLPRINSALGEQIIAALRCRAG